MQSSIIKYLICVLSVMLYICSISIRTYTIKWTWNVSYDQHVVQVQQRSLRAGEGREGEGEKVDHSH